MGLLLFLIGIIFLFVQIKSTSHKGKHGKDVREANYRDVMLATVGLCAAYAGFVTLYYLPIAIAGNSDNAVFAGRLTMGVIFLVTGLLIKHVTGVFLMVMGIAGLAFASPFIFNNLGSGGALGVAVLAFAVLVVFAVRMSKKTENHG